MRDRTNKSNRIKFEFLFENCFKRCEKIMIVAMFKRQLHEFFSFFHRNCFKRKKKGKNMLYHHIMRRKKLNFGPFICKPFKGWTKKFTPKRGIRSLRINKSTHILNRHPCFFAKLPKTAGIINQGTLTGGKIAGHLNNFPSKIHRKIFPRL